MITNIINPIRMTNKRIVCTLNECGNDAIWAITIADQMQFICLAHGVLALAKLLHMNTPIETGPEITIEISDTPEETPSPNQ